MAEPTHDGHTEADDHLDALLAAGLTELIDAIAAQQERSTPGATAANGRAAD